MKVSLIVSPANDGQDFVAKAQAKLDATELQVVIEPVWLSAELEPSAALFQALGSCSGEWIAVLGPGSDPGSVLELVQGQRALRDRELTAVILEARLSGAVRLSRMGHRLMCRLGGKRSPPAGDSSVLFERRWLPALLRLPATPHAQGSAWDLPLALAVLGVEWKRVWTAPRVSPTALATRLSGWRRLLLVGALFELGLLGAVALYALSGVLIILGSRSSWALKGVLGLVLGLVLVLVLGTLQLVARRKLRPALALSAEARADLVRPDRESQGAQSA